MDVGIHSRYAIKCTLVIIFELMIAKWVYPDIIHRVYNLWAHSFVKRTFWKWAHSSGRAYNKMSPHPYYGLIVLVKWAPEFDLVWINLFPICPEARQECCHDTNHISQSSHESISTGLAPSSFHEIFCCGVCCDTETPSHEHGQFSNYSLWGSIIGVGVVIQSRLSK